MCVNSTHEGFSYEGVENAAPFEGTGIIVSLIRNRVLNLKKENSTSGENEDIKTFKYNPCQLNIRVKCFA